MIVYPNTVAIVSHVQTLFTAIVRNRNSRKGLTMRDYGRHGIAWNIAYLGSAAGLPGCHVAWHSVAWAEARSTAHLRLCQVVACFWAGFNYIKSE